MKKIFLISAFALIVMSLAGFGFWKTFLYQATAGNIDEIPMEELVSTNDFVYQNKTHNFTLNFPQSWVKFNVSEHSNAEFDSTCFSFDEAQPLCIFSIIKLTNVQWEKLKSKQEKNVLLKTNDLVYLCDGCCKQNGDITGGGQFSDFQSKKCSEVPDIIKTFNVLNVKISDLKVYYTQDGFLSFKYPANLEKMIYSKKFNLSIGSKQDITDEFAQYKDGGCPSTCGQLVADPVLFQKQFDILSRMNTLTDCVLTPKDKQEIKDNFILFSGGINGKYEIVGIKTDLNECGLKIIQSDGFDASLSNMNYNVSLFVNNEIININFPLFPHGVFANVDMMWKNFGFDSANSICDATCLKNQLEYYNKFSIDNDIEKEVISTYDQIIKSLKFIDPYKQN